MDAKQLRELIIRPTLKYLDPEIPYSIEAEDLLLATACAESQCGHYIKQTDGGPAEGIWQMEPATEEDNWTNFINHRSKLKNLTSNLTSDYFYSDLISSPPYACAQARIKFYRDPASLPNKYEYFTKPKGYEGYMNHMARYWKRVYNTELGKGTVDGFIDKVEKYGDFK